MFHRFGKFVSNGSVRPKLSVCRIGADMLDDDESADDGTGTGVPFTAQAPNIGPASATIATATAPSLSCKVGRTLHINLLD